MNHPTRFIESQKRVENLGSLYLTQYSTVNKQFPSLPHKVHYIVKNVDILYINHADCVWRGSA